MPQLVLGSIMIPKKFQEYLENRLNKSEIEKISLAELERIKAAIKRIKKDTNKAQ